MIDKATQERIKEAADIVDVVSDYVHLIRSGANFKGLCPFHNERTPSFSVNRYKNFCYCFSCKKGGSPVNFLMEKEGISYWEAMRQLAKRYGIKIEERELTDEEKQKQARREGMLLANEWAMQEMQHNLTETSEGSDVGLQYLYSRGVTREAIKAFRLGYSMDAFDSLTKAASKRGFDLDILHELGLLSRSDKGHYYDKFRGRVMFPILNSSGKVIAFGGRDLKGGPAKYLNSPESDLYHKSNELYGIFQARDTMGKENRCYLVEGYLDVIGMWQSGLKNVVASSGTSLTEGQIALIKRFTPNVTLIYDGDDAGIKASLRGIDMLLAQEMNVKVLLLPDGDDPDSFARKNTPEDFRKYVEEHQTDIIRFKVQVLMKSAGNDPQMRAEVINSVITSLAHIPDRVTRDVYIKECSSMLHINEETVARSVGEQFRKILADKKIRESRNAQNPAGNNAAARSAESAYTLPASPDTTGNNENAFIRVETYPLLPLEKKIIEYCVRYGFMDFCELCDENENKYPISVVEFVKDELDADNTKFTVPPYAKLFRLLIDMLPEYRKNASERMEVIKDEAEKIRQDGISRIAEKGLSIREIELEERNLEEEISNYISDQYEDFSKSYSARKLTSDESDEIREIANQAVRERHQLSKIYSRDHKPDREEDKLADYLPRSITELKKGILDIRLAQYMKELKDISAAGNPERERELQLSLASIMKIRSQIAKDIGERIVCPPRRR